MRRKIIDCGGRLSEEFEAGTETRQEDNLPRHLDIFDFLNLKVFKNLSIKYLFKPRTCFIERSQSAKFCCASCAIFKVHPPPWKISYSCPCPCYIIILYLSFEL